MKLRIAEDTACIASKTSYIEEDGLDKNGIYYFGKKPNTPKNWKDVFKTRNLTDKESKIYEEWLNHEAIHTGETLEGLLSEYENDKNSHYFYVMAWKDEYLGSAPIRKKKFDIYDDAVDYFNRAVDDFGENAFVQMFEYSGGKRKIIADSEDGLL